MGNANGEMVSGEVRTEQHDNGRTVYIKMRSNADAAMLLAAICEVAPHAASKLGDRITIWTHQLKEASK